jgi:hypothetical protein
MIIHVDQEDFNWQGRLYVLPQERQLPSFAYEQATAECGHTLDRWTIVILPGVNAKRLIRLQSTSCKAARCGGHRDNLAQWSYSCRKSLGISWGTEADFDVHRGRRPRYLTSHRMQRRRFVATITVRVLNSFWVKRCRSTGFFSCAE